MRHKELHNSIKSGVPKTDVVKVTGCHFEKCTFKDFGLLFIFACFVFTNNLKVIREIFFYFLSIDLKTKL